MGFTDDLETGGRTDLGRHRRPLDGPAAGRGHARRERPSATGPAGLHLPGQYARVFAYGAATAPDADGWHLRGLLDSTINTEMDLHREYAAEFGISAAVLERPTPRPPTRAYTDFLVPHGRDGHLRRPRQCSCRACGRFNRTAKRLEAQGKPITSGTPPGSRCTPVRSSPNSRRGAPEPAGRRRRRGHRL